MAFEIRIYKTSKKLSLSWITKSSFLIPRQNNSKFSFLGVSSSDHKFIVYHLLLPPQTSDHFIVWSRAGGLMLRTG